MTPSVLAVAHMQGSGSMYYYSTTFSGGPGVSPLSSSYHSIRLLTLLIVALLTSLPQNALLTEGRQTG